MKQAGAAGAAVATRRAGAAAARRPGRTNVLAAAMLVWLGHSACTAPSEPAADPVVAKVLGQPVWQAEVAAHYALARQSLGAAELPPSSLDALWQSSIDDVVIGHLIVRAAKEHQVAVLEEELAGALSTFAVPPAATQNVATSALGEAKAIGEPALPQAGEGAAAHSQTAPSQADLREAMRRRLLVGKLLAQEVTARIYVSDQDVAALAAAEPGLLRSKARLRLRYVQLGAFKALLPALRRAVSQGAEPDADGHLPALPLTVEETGWQSETSLPAEVWAAVRGLPSRRLSEPVAFGDGVAVFWLLERQPERVESLAQASRRLRGSLRREREQRAEVAMLDRLRAAAQVEMLQAKRPSSAR